MKTQKILFLYLNAGGGHLSCAKTLSECLYHTYDKKVNCVFVDGIGKSKLLKHFVEDGYRISMSGSGVMSSLFYTLNQPSYMAKTSVAIFNLFIKSYLKEIFLKEKPDKVVIMHGALTRSAELVLKELGLDIPVIVVITDPFTLYPFWFTGKNAHYILFSDEARRTALKKNIPKEQITQFPCFVNEKYSKKLSSKDCLEVKKRLGFSKDKKLLLVLGGGEGIKNGQILLEKIVTYVFKNSLDIDIAIVCGRNVTLKRYCDTLALKYSNSVHIHVYGFVDFIYELLNVCDIIVTKGGPATVIEILLLDKIPILNSYVWGQEKGNVEFVIKHDVGYYQPDVSKIPLLISKLLSNNNIVKKLHQNIKNLKLQNGTKQTSEFIYNYTSK